MSNNIIAIIGTVGVPSNYGGFETLAENLVRYHDIIGLPEQLTVYCSSKAYAEKKPSYLSARLRYIPLYANGAQSIPYDIWSLVSSSWNRMDVILLLGVSGAIALPFVRAFSSARIVTNIDGIEWSRQKWRGLAKRFLRFSERMAVRYSHEVIADNQSIADYVWDTYGVTSHMIAYGGDHAVAVKAKPVEEYQLPAEYAFSVCRIEPENNIHVIIEAFSNQDGLPLVLVGNWNRSDYGRSIRERYAACTHMYLLDPIYDAGKLKTLRSGAKLYIHGHSAGGTNPSLVEAMHFGHPILAYDCDSNRYTTENKALFYKTSEDLLRLLQTMDKDMIEEVGQEMLEIARRRYTWKTVAREYFDLLTAPI